MKDMVAVFKTNVWDGRRAENLVEILCRHLPDCKINFDLDDCDKVLRIEGTHPPADRVKTIVKENGYWCEPLK
jgi:hypothetical protein